jgi:hypothetical protein
LGWLCLRTAAFGGLLQIEADLDTARIEHGFLRCCVIPKQYQGDDDSHRRPSERLNDTRCPIAPDARPPRSAHILSCHVGSLPFCWLEESINKPATLDIPLRTDSSQRNN